MAKSLSGPRRTRRCATEPGFRLKRDDSNGWYTVFRGAPLSEMMDFVKWYNLRRYVSRTFISKIPNLSDLRNATQ